MQIRYATKNDIPFIADFNSAMAKETEGKPLDFQLLMAGVNAVINDEEKGFYLVAIENDTIIGQLLVTKEWSDWRNGYFWWIQSVYVHLDYRNQHVFKAMFQYVKNLARDEGNICGLRLYVDKSNSIAKNVYQNMGWVETEYLMYKIDWSEQQ